VKRLVNKIRAFFGFRPTHNEADLKASIARHPSNSQPKHKI
jgi:hypothetical protein